ncbi:hypothetical protein M885DRAFT_581387 [Pelagophyceae sp. CCMP2097]|nr:hypothetical protein M885DRAFT_581387 [Pelagophyceae sp. CCMP2097]
MLRLGNFLRGAAAPVRSVAASVAQRLSSSGHTSGGASTDDDDYDDDDEPDEPDEASRKNRGGRPRGASAVERVLIGEFASKAEAIKAGERAAGTDTHRTSGGSWDYAATAGICILNCWAHISRKFRDGKLKLKHTANLGVIEGHVHALRHTVSRAQFFYLWAHIRKFWETELDEAAYAKTFAQYYVGLFAGVVQLWHANWFVTASGVAGVTAVSQNIESGNNTIKVLLGSSALYSSVSYFYAVSLQKIMIDAAKLIPARTATACSP